MASVLESLKAVNAYPIPLRTLVEVGEARALTLNSEASQDVLRSAAFKLATADLLLWLSLAPNIAQGGQNYSFSDEQRQQFRNRANALYDEFEDDAEKPKPIYGYKGSRL